MVHRFLLTIGVRYSLCGNTLPKSSFCYCHWEHLTSYRLFYLSYYFFFYFLLKFSGRFTSRSYVSQLQAAWSRVWRFIISICSMDVIVIAHLFSASCTRTRNFTALLTAIHRQWCALVAQRYIEIQTPGYIFCFSRFWRWKCHSKNSYSIHRSSLQLLLLATVMADLFFVISKLPEFSIHRFSYFQIAKKKKYVYIYIYIYEALTGNDSDIEWR